MSPPSPPLPAMRHLACARCGAAFACGSDAGACWCAAEDFRLPMPPPNSTQDCVCPICLAQAVREQGALSTTLC